MKFSLATLESLKRVKSTRFLGSLLVFASLLAIAATAYGQDGSPYRFGADSEYRTLFDPDGPMGWLSPRIIIWVLAQLHLLFAAFVLAVPMFAVIIEIVGILSKDEEQSKKYDDLAHEFTKLLTTAFSVTSILGAIFTFCCMGFYPRMFGYLVEVFGPSMYLYACIFFGESFSLYLYYYGWNKFSKKLHAFLGLMLNVFGITLMLVANAWTTFTMAPAGIAEDGAVVDRYAAFFNYLLNPINVHRLIANLCMGGSVAAAYAAYNWLSTTDPEKRAHYDWMGYIGNFIAVLALLPLPFAGYYLGFEIYAFNQQLGINMMGGVLSWLFVLQAVLIGALFFAANFYLWLGMDRIDGSERYRGWIKFLLGVITLGIVVWATPKSLILTSAEIDVMGGTNHPILSLLGVMSAKNTAVNLIILATFLSFLLYRRGNKVPTVAWANIGNAIQALAFGAAVAVVVVIGVGGYIPSMWMESTLRVAMSPYQVVAVLVCMFIVMPIDIAMMRNAKEIGRIRWGEVSPLSQYTLLFLAITFTWTMALMGFVRSSLRQHWHVYEVLQDTSPEAYTPSIGYATVVVTAVVILFFALVGMVIWISQLGKPAVEKPAEPVTAGKRWGPLVGAIATLGAIVGGVVVFGGGETTSAPAVADGEQKEDAVAVYSVVDPEKGVYQVPVAQAMDMLVKDPSNLEPPVKLEVNLDEMSPAERGEFLFQKSDLACGACHSIDGTAKQAPTMLARFGKLAALADGSSVTFDADYLKESLMDPKAKFAQGFDKASNPAAAEMPGFQDQITPQMFDDLLAYLKSL